MLRHTRFLLPLAALAAFTVFSTEAARPAMAQPAEPPTAPDEADEGVETLLRGPLHEAYAEPVQTDPSGGEIISKEPPEPIEEIPPETKPADESVIWIPGYWAWDADREDYLWVSGVWRVPPPDRRWVPGYWTEADGGYQWIPGFWAAAEVERVEYLPQPPESLESGPTSDQPSEDHYWVNGSWQYRNSRYAWQPGYWGTYQDGWVWLPSHYTWTPRGVIYVDGYWDYPLRRRGQIFAPVYFHRPLYRRSGYYYSPSVAIDTGHLLLHLFVQPRRHHYYWGDYYGDRYRTAGYHNWSHRHDRYGYDPLFSYYQSHYRHQNIDFARRIDGWNKHYTKNKDSRPAHTFAAQAKLAERAKDDKHLQQSLLGRTTKEVMSDRGSSNRYRRLEENERRSYADARQEHRELSNQRVAIESKRTTRPDEKKSDDGRESDDRGRDAAEWKLPEHRRHAAADSTRRPPAKTPATRGDRVDDTRRGDREDRGDRDRSDRPKDTKDKGDSQRDDNRPKRDDKRDDSKPKVEKRKVESKDRPQQQPRPKADPPKRAKPEKSKPEKKEKKK